MWTRMNLVRFFCCLLVIDIIGITIACAEPQPRFAKSEDASNIKKFTDDVTRIKNFASVFGPRYGKRYNNATPMELNTICWEILKMIQDVQMQNKQQKQENIRQNKEQIMLRDFPSLDADEYMSYDV